MTKNPLEPYDAICGVVLAGGKSRRMGRNKSLMPFQGKALITQATDVLSALFPEVVIVCDALSHSEKIYAQLPFRVLCDQTAGLGPIAGIETALQSLPGKGLFVVAADMPFLKHRVIKEMLSHVTGYDLVIPKLEGRLHPLHAFYAPTCLPNIREAIRSKTLALHLLSTQVRTCFFPEEIFRKIDPDLISVFNINTPKTLTEAEALFSSKETRA